MRCQVWIHDENGSVFYRQSDYLEYMRGRLRDRKAKARLIEARTAALERLRAIYDVNRFHEIEEFLNDNIDDIHMACRTRHPDDQRILRTPISVLLQQEYHEYWSVKVSFSYKNPNYDEKSFRERYEQSTRLEERRPLVENNTYFEFNVRDVRGVLEQLGFKCRGGGGSHILSYHMEIMKSRFPSVAVMERLAAA